MLGYQIRNKKLNRRQRHVKNIHENQNNICKDLTRLLIITF